MPRETKVELERRWRRKCRDLRQDVRYWQWWAGEWSEQAAIGVMLMREAANALRGLGDMERATLLENLLDRRRRSLQAFHVEPNQNDLPT